MAREALVEERMAVWFWESVFESAGEGRDEVCRLVESAFGALGDQGWWG